MKVDLTPAQWRSILVSIRKAKDLTPTSVRLAEAIEKEFRTRADSQGARIQG